jgi:hypothetical protein
LNAWWTSSDISLINFSTDRLQNFLLLLGFFLFFPLISLFLIPDLFLFVSFLLTLFQLLSLLLFFILQLLILRRQMVDFGF